jgi:hypothetical protein
MLRRTFVLAAAAAPLISATAFAHAPLTIPLDLTRRQPRVRLAIGGVERGEAIFDTGAFGSTFHLPLAQELGLPNNGPIEITSGAGGPPIAAFITRVPNAALNGVAIPDFDAAVFPMVRSDTVAVLSPAIFNGQLVRLDFQQSQMQILDKSTLPAGEAVPYVGADYPLPAIPVTLPGDRHYEAHLDTGSPASLTLPHDLAAVLPLSTELVEVGRARMVNTERVIYRATLNGEVRVGPLTLINPDITFMESFNHANVGMALLRQLNITLDPAERRLWLEAHA